MTEDSWIGKVIIYAGLDRRLLSAKLADEERALDLCRTKARQKKLPMEVIDAEFQWQVVHLEGFKLTFSYGMNAGTDVN